MSAFQTATPSMQKLDPLKRVKYTFGLVLGVDEFEQEQTYLMEKVRAHSRLAHGYGTVCGLRVEVDDSSMLVHVTPGVAISPQGQEIHIRRDMCARLNDWLTSNGPVLATALGAPPLTVPLCVVLSYSECATDTVPVPGEPCRTQEDALAASRLLDSFDLRLCLDADQVIASPSLDPSSLPAGLCFRPSEAEEDAIRNLGLLLRRIRVPATAASFTQQKELEDLVRKLTSPETSLPSSPPWEEAPLYVHAEEAADFVRAALLVWVTEVRPALAARRSQASCELPGEQCVLLAELNFNVDRNWRASGTVSIDQTRRPFLVQTRLLQECLLWLQVGMARFG